MKKIILSVLVICCSVLLVKGQSRVGGGFAYGTDINEFALNVNGEFFLKDNLAIGPELNYFFTEPGSFWTLNADAHFYLLASGAASLYALAGLNFATASFSGNSNSELGLNLGGGANFDINSSITPFGQLKFVLNDFDQAVFSFGIRVDLN